MRFFSGLFWVAAFLLATYTWMVVFEHGFVWENFQHGFMTEWQQVVDLVMAKQPAIAPAPTP